MKIENNTYGFQEKMFDIIINIAFLLAICAYFGFSQYSKELNDLYYYIKIYVCLYLIWRFNPLRSNYELTKLDIKIAFNAGLFILATTALSEYIKNIENETVTKFKKLKMNQSN